VAVNNQTNVKSHQLVNNQAISNQQEEIPIEIIKEIENYLSNKELLHKQSNNLLLYHTIRLIEVNTEYKE
jgi:hypothetical protein